MSSARMAAILSRGCVNRILHGYSTSTGTCKIAPVPVTQPGPDEYGDINQIDPIKAANNVKSQSCVYYMRYAVGMPYTLDVSGKYIR